MSNDDFWTTLAAGHTNTVLSGAMDTHLSGKSLDESFGSVRDLTDKMRSANALPLPVEAGTKVVFAGGLGAYLAYENPPEKDATGEVVTVKSATGNITHHEGNVFVQWDDGALRTIHADHLRLVGQNKQAAGLVEGLESILSPGQASDHPEVKKFLSMMEQAFRKHFPRGHYTSRAETKFGSPGIYIATHTLPKGEQPSGILQNDPSRNTFWMFDSFSPAGMNDRIKIEMSEGNRLYGADPTVGAVKVGWRNATAAPASIVRKFDQYFGKLRKLVDAQQSRMASDLKADFEKIKALAEAKPDNDFLKSLLKQMADKGFAPTDKQMKVVDKIEKEVDEMGEMQKELKALTKKGGRMPLPGEKFEVTSHYTDIAGMGQYNSTLVLEFIVNDDGSASLMERGKPSPHKENMMSPEQVKRLFQRGYGGGLNMSTSLSEPKIVRASSTKTAGYTVKVRRDGGDYWIEAKDQLVGKLTAAQALKEVERHLKNPDVVVMGRNHSLGRSGVADAYSTAPFVILDRRGDVVDEGYTLEGLWKKWFDRFLGWKMASRLRVASLGDLTQFLKAADGKLVHKATNDLWSYSKDADGNFLVERLFDDEGEPLKA